MTDIAALPDENTLEISQRKLAVCVPTRLEPDAMYMNRPLTAVSQSGVLILSSNRFAAFPVPSACSYARHWW